MSTLPFRVPASSLRRRPAESLWPALVHGMTSKLGEVRYPPSAHMHIIVCVTLVCMAQVDRLSVTMPPAIGAAVREAAARQGTSVSTWLASAAAQRLRSELLGAALDRWEAEEGPFTDEELNAAASALAGAHRRRAS